MEFLAGETETETEGGDGVKSFKDRELDFGWERVEGTSVGTIRYGNG